MQVKKRNGQVVMFQQSKVSNAIWKAMTEVDEQDEIIMMDITDEIRKLVGLYESVGNDIMSVEAIQDKIEMMLAEKGLFKTSKAYILYRKEREVRRKKGWDLKGLPKDIYEKKYRFRDETFDEFLDRVSGGNSYIKKLMRDKKFLPAGRVLAGRGLNERGNKVVYSNCFVITPPEDNIESIFDTAKKMARTYSMGGGCGTSLENLRPNGARVNNSAESTTGAVSFMDLYSLTTGLIGMKGRRGALMLTMPVTHPDILEFINIKNDLTKVTKANISVMISDDFMYAVKHDKEWHMKFYAETGEVIERVVPAKLIFHEISKSAWNTAEPGILYWDRVEKWHINSENKNMKYRSTNP